jgi:peptide/nickel transport system substrate-binding protein
MTMTAVASPAKTALAFLGPAELDHLDPRSPYTIRSGQLLGLLSRRLFGYRPMDDAADDASSGVPVADLALAIPTVDNGGVSPDGRTYRFRLRRGVYWDGQGARELVAGDLVRGFKRIAHPNAAAARGYFTETIVGMREYCEAYDAELGGWQANAPDFAQFQARQQVAGIRAVDPHTLEIELIAPANDLLHLLATGVAAAAPREYDYYVPDSHELLRNAPSAGPYRISRARSRGAELVLEPNPRWNPATDPIHQRPVEEIRIGDQAGNADQPDLAWSFGTVSWTPAADVPAAGWGFGHYLLANLRPGEPASGSPGRRAGCRAGRRPRAGGRCRLRHPRGRPAWLAAGRRPATAG